jgi:hypothetical protein
MAGKYAFYFPYKIIDSLEAGNIKDAEFKQFILGIVEYDRAGTIPAFENTGLAMLFASIKPEIDFCQEKYKGLVEKRRAAGKIRRNSTDRC